jgi:16S rRNA (guanine527-N7)-methyltransferase
VRDPAEMLRLHLLDSLAAVPPLQRHLALAAPAKAAAGGACWTWGGGGLPGVVFAICCPGWP